MRLISGLLAMLLTGVLAWPVLAQTGAPAPAPPVNPGAPATGGASAIAIVLIVTGLLLALGIAVKLVDLRRKREAEAVQLQAQISDALLRDPALFNLPITPSAHVPFWSGSPATVEIAGQVPIPELREAVLRIVRAEAERVRPDVRIEDRLAVVPFARAA